MSSTLPICRVCLKTSLEYIDFDTPFDVDSSKEDENDLTYLDCFLACTRLDIEISENCPHSLCSSCGYELKIAYEFLLKAESADKYLREYSVSAKVEKEDEVQGHSFHQDEFVIYEQQENDEINKQEEPSKQIDDEKSFVCTVCGEQFFSQFVLNLHVNRLHSENAEDGSQLIVDKVECQICDIVVPSNKFDSHMQLHEESNSLEYDTNSSHFVAMNNDEQEIDVVEDTAFELLDSTNDSSMDMEDVADSQDDNSESRDEYSQDQAEDIYNEIKMESKSVQDARFSVIDKILTDEEKKRISKPNFKLCTICNKHIRLASFETHMNVHNGIRQFACEFCPNTFFSKRSLQKHSKTSHTEKVKSDCKICHQTMEGTSIKKHIEESHSHVVTCTNCDYQCQEFKMNDHMKRKHSESKDFLCYVCSKTFSTLGILNAHLKYHERKQSNIKSDACEICGKSFSTNHYLKSHMLTHQDERELFQCEECDKTYHSKAALDNHIRMHKGDTLQCLLCSKQFARQYELNVHMRFHTKEYPFECEICGKKFAIKGHLRTHMWRHQGLKLQCEECGKLFTSTKALQEHSFYHTEMPFPCPYCTKAYPSKPKFKVHLKTAHMVEFSNEELQKMSKFPIPKRSRSKKFTLVQADSVMKEVEVHTKEEIE